MFNSNQAFVLVQKLNSAPRAFTLGVKAEIEKKSFQSAPKLLINAQLYGLVLAPSNLGSQSAILGAKEHAKNAQSWLAPRFFGPDS